MNRQDAKNAKAEPGENLDNAARSVIGAAIEVHRHLGPGYLESIYEEALSIELASQNIPFERQLAIPVRYKNQVVGQGRLDFLINHILVVELKAVDALTPIHKAQVISYLKATGAQLGLLVNFNVASLKQGIQRVVLTAK